ncbi:MAG: alpha/beta hydrolase [Candidatus Methanomethylophilaceae archaeon]|nr:alpha/beta hydrolase [Candidatus Methanomethylophilaceae archaeon]
MFAEINNLRIHYERSGSGPPLIMLHGNGEDTGIFSCAAGVLKDYCTVYLVDSRGHGLSQKAPEYHYDLMAEDIHVLISVLGIEGAALYGYSDGGIIGLMLSSAHPRDISCLITSGANTAPDAIDWCGSFPDPENPVEAMMIHEPHISGEQLGKISVPCLVLAGEYDAVRREDTEFIHRCIRNSELMIVPGEDHGSYIVNSPVLPEIIKSWLLKIGYIRER